MGLSKFIKLQQEEYKPLRGNEKVVEKYTKSLDYKNWPYALGYPYIYVMVRRQVPFQLFYREDNGKLFIIYKRNKLYHNMLYASVNASESEVISEMRRLNIKRAYISTFCPDGVAERMHKVDPIYYVPDFLDLSGRAKKSIRNKINKFERLYHPYLEEYRPSMLHSVLKIISEWAKDRKIREKKARNWTTGTDVAFSKAWISIISKGLFEHKTFVMFANGEPAGVISYAKYRNRFWATMTGKTLPKYRGGNDWMWYMSVEKLRGLVDYFNDGTVEHPGNKDRRGDIRYGLYYYKMKFQPTYLLHLWSFRIR